MSAFANSRSVEASSPLGAPPFAPLRNSAGETRCGFSLTADEFGAEEARRIGLVQGIVARGRHVERAVEIARTIAAKAPLGVRGTLENARAARAAAEQAAIAHLRALVPRVMASEDAREGLQSFLERREGKFTGR